MAKSDSLDDKVAGESSFLKKVWSKGKYAVAVLGVAYVINGGYHLSRRQDIKINLNVN